MKTKESGTFQVIIAKNPRELGELVVNRLFDYIEQHPNGVIALPTGKTPKPFIQALKRSRSIPATAHLRFIQLDEYFPLPPDDPKSFCCYVRENYLSVLKIAPERSLTMDGLFESAFSDHAVDALFPNRRIDLSLLQKEPVTSLQRSQKNALEKAAQFCCEYERTIRQWGGIGFFLGGIGLDGHIAFNLSGSSRNSKTRLVDLGTAVAATIGIQTICWKPDVQTVLFASGADKASIVARAIEGKPSIDVPATALRFTKNPQFYLTPDAAQNL